MSEDRGESRAPSREDIPVRSADWWARALTVGEVAEDLQCAEQTIWNYCKQGLIPSFKMGRHWRVRRVDLEDYKASMIGCHGRSQTAATDHPVVPVDLDPPPPPQRRERLPDDVDPLAHYQDQGLGVEADDDPPSSRAF